MRKKFNVLAFSVILISLIGLFPPETSAAPIDCRPFVVDSHTTTSSSDKQSEGRTVTYYRSTSTRDWSLSYPGSHHMTDKIRFP